MSEKQVTDDYLLLRSYTTAVKTPQRAIIGRDVEMQAILAAFHRPELCNVILIADAGVGKSSLVQGVMVQDKDRKYLEVDLSRMIAGLKNVDELAGLLKQLFDETIAYVKEYKKQIVLFIDEFHLIVQLSAAAVEALKPLLADSGTRNVRVIAATTYEEFRKYIAPNQPLVERLQRISLPQTNKETTVKILKDMAARYGVSGQFYDDSIFEMIYEYTNRYIPANSQPRKSILLLDNMIGWHRYKNVPMNMQLLADVLYHTQNVNILFRVDATKIKQELDKKVFSQTIATKAIEDRLHMCVADLNHPDKPQATMLFTGSTGVGKPITNSSKVPIFKDITGQYMHYKPHGELQYGDLIFNRKGEPVMVDQVFQKGKLPVYEMELSDGRIISCAKDHLWSVSYAETTNHASGFTLISTQALMEYMEQKSGRWYLPVGKAVSFEEKKYSVAPYVIGSLLAERTSTDCFSYELSTREFYEIKTHIDAEFKYYGIDSMCMNLEECYGEYSFLNKINRNDLYIPLEYKYGSITQRWSLIQGFFDRNGMITDAREGFRISYYGIGKQLVYDIQEVLYSLGVTSVIVLESKERDKYQISVVCSNELKKKFFKILSKYMKAREAVFHKDCMVTDRVRILNITKTDKVEEMSCITVEDEEHLYQVGDYVVTHNTEIAKQLSRLLFEDERNLIRFDMSEYSNADTLRRFQTELTSKVWARPFSIVLLDEIEKACAVVTRLLLQVLDEGRLTDENGRETSFSNCYIIMTTNLASEIYKTVGAYALNTKSDIKSLNGGVDEFRLKSDEERLKEYIPVIKESLISTAGDNKFPPELINRINCVVPFMPLSLDTQRRVVIHKLKELERNVKVKHGVELRIDKKVVSYLVDDRLSSDSDAGGARQAVTKMEEEVVSAVAKFINTHPNHKLATVYVEGTLAIDDKNQRVSDAKIIVK